MTETVLVTGGAGFVGSHVCKALAESGLHPVAYDNMSRGHRWAVQWGPLVTGDISDRSALSAAIVRYEPSAVLHFASSIEAGASVEDPGAYYENNVCNTLALLQTVRAHDIDRIVFSSSAAVYGDPETVPIPESHPTQPVNPYGATKLMCERILQDFAGGYGLCSVSLRYFNAAGADRGAGIGEAHDPETHLIPLVLDAAEGLRKDIAVFGEDYDTPDGTCIRDYVHVSDLAEAHCLALARTKTGDGATACNLGTGHGHSVRAVIAAVERVTGKSVPVRSANRRPGDPPALVADPTAAIRDLGWKPRFSDIDTQISDAWRWHRRRPANSGNNAGDGNNADRHPASLTSA